MRTFKHLLWVWSLRQIRRMVWFVDEWVHAEELKLREPAARAAAQAEVDPAASRKRERAIRKVSKARAPRLRYQAGQFVQVER